MKEIRSNQEDISNILESESSMNQENIDPNAVTPTTSNHGYSYPN